MLGVVNLLVTQIQAGSLGYATCSAHDPVKSATMTWRGAACGSQRRLKHLQALQAAPLQVLHTGWKPMLQWAARPFDVQRSTFGVRVRRLSFEFAGAASDILALWREQQQETLRNKVAFHFPPLYD
jgi:hypothetical protein